VVPEKQGLKLAEVETRAGTEKSLSSGSRKTRIETLKRDKNGSRQDSSK